jgi:hypothetical protein
MTALALHRACDGLVEWQKVDAAAGQVRNNRPELMARVALL